MHIKRNQLKAAFISSMLLMPSARAADLDLGAIWQTIEGLAGNFGEVLSQGGDLWSMLDVGLGACNQAGSELAQVCDIIGKVSKYAKVFIEGGFENIGATLFQNANSILEDLGIPEASKYVDFASNLYNHVKDGNTGDALMSISRFGREVYNDYRDRQDAVVIGDDVSEDRAALEDLSPDLALENEAAAEDAANAAEESAMNSLKRADLSNSLENAGETMADTTENTAVNLDKEKGVIAAIQQKKMAATSSRELMEVTIDALSAMLRTQTLGNQAETELLANLNSNAVMTNNMMLSEAQEALKEKMAEIDSQMAQQEAELRALKDENETIKKMAQNNLGKILNMVTNANSGMMLEDTGIDYLGSGEEDFEKMADEWNSQKNNDLDSNYQDQSTFDNYVGSPEDGNSDSGTPQDSNPFDDYVPPSDGN